MANSSSNSLVGEDWFKNVKWRKSRVIPTLLLKNQGFVKTIKFNKPTYLGDPVNIVKIFNEKEVDELIILDITATIEKKSPNFKLLEDIAGECFMPLGYGGGIKTVEDISKLLRLGFEKVCLNTVAIENPIFVREAAERYGSQSIVISLDVKRGLLGQYQVVTQAGKKNTRRDPVEVACQMQAMGAGELFLNSIDRDGMMQGYDLELIQKVTHAVDIPVIVCGGASKVEDFRDAILTGGASAVAAGSFFVFQGKHRAVLINMPTTEQLEQGGIP